MSHLYPLAISAEDALDAPTFSALTLAAAERLAAGRPVLGLETEWLTLSVDAAEAARNAAQKSVGVGFVQTYEDADGAPVLAVTYWKLGEADQAQEKPVQAPPAAADTPEADHTDDLYFRSGRTKKRGRKKKIDPNQMDLFGTGSDT